MPQRQPGTPSRRSQSAESPRRNAASDRSSSSRTGQAKPASASGRRTGGTSDGYQSGRGSSGGSRAGSASSERRNTSGSGAAGGRTTSGRPFSAGTPSGGDSARRAPVRGRPTRADSSEERPTFRQRSDGSAASERRSPSSDRRATTGSGDRDRPRARAAGPGTGRREAPQGRTWSREPASRRGSEDNHADGRSTRFERPDRADQLQPPEDADPALLDRSVRAELRSLSKINAEVVARHLVAAGELLDTDPRKALAHAQAARGRAARIGAVREAVGLAAYHCGEWAEALSELRAARRITGDARNIAVMADCERALGRPAQALRALDDPGAKRIDAETRIELLIVVASARRDLGQIPSALAVLERGGLRRDDPGPGALRLWYCYADVLQSAGRKDEAAIWFAAAAGLDRSGATDAAERAADLL